MDKLIGGVLGSVGRIVTVIAKELIKGGLVIYVVASEVCEATSLHFSNLIEEAEAELEGREPHYKEVPKEEEEELEDLSLLTVSPSLALLYSNDQSARLDGRTRKASMAAGRHIQSGGSMNHEAVSAASSRNRST